MAAVGAATPVFAQDAAPGPGKVVITIIPGGATFFTEAEDNPLGPSFGNYELGGSVAVNFNRYVGLEGEVSGALGVSQTMQVGDVHVRWTLAEPAELQRQPRALSAEPFVGGAVPHRWCGRPDDVRAAALTVDDAETFLTGNVGGGIAWHAGRWGLRGDYRFIAVQSKDDAPAFFGREERYGHRVYAGLLLNIGQ